LYLKRKFIEKKGMMNNPIHGATSVAWALTRPPHYYSIKSTITPSYPSRDDWTSRKLLDSQPGLTNWGWLGHSTA